MNQKIDPKRIVLTTMPRKCKKCSNVQHVFFTSQKEYDDWTCPVCEGRIVIDEESSDKLIIS